MQSLPCKTILRLRSSQEAIFSQTASVSSVGARRSGGKNCTPRVSWQTTLTPLSREIHSASSHLIHAVLFEIIWLPSDGPRETPFKLVAIEEVALFLQGAQLSSLFVTGQEPSWIEKVKVDNWCQEMRSGCGRAKKKKKRRLEFLEKERKLITSGLLSLWLKRRSLSHVWNKWGQVLSRHECIFCCNLLGAFSANKCVPVRH